MSTKEQLDTLSYAAVLAKEGGYSNDVVGLLESFVEALDITAMTFDELEQCSSYYGASTYVGNGAVVNRDVHSMLDSMDGTG
jgi:hypothetical protein